MNRKVSPIVAAAVAGALLVGCSHGKEVAVDVRDSEMVRTEARKISSRILELMAHEGKVTATDAMIEGCSEFPAEDDVYLASHPWSVYDLPVPDLQEAMDRLRTELPKAGWKITKDGVDDTPAKSPQIIAESDGGKFVADIRLQDRRGAGGDPSLIEVRVESACYREK